MPSGWRAGGWRGMDGWREEGGMKGNGADKEYLWHLGVMYVW